MGNSFFAYLQQLELLAFFSGYPLIYLIAVSFAGNRQEKNNFKSRLILLLPFTYALMGTLFLGYQLKKLYPYYSLENIQETFQHPYLVAWALLSLLFWIPFIAQKKVLSLFHSLVFFLILVKDFFLQLSASDAENDVLRNDMKIYTLSLLLNLGAFALIILLSFLITFHRKRRGSSPVR